MKKVLNIPLETKFEVIKSTHIYTTPSGTEFFADKVPEIKPIKGEFFVKRKNLELKPGDWVIFGVASTPNVDLVNDAILDVKYTFGDSLEEFVNAGRIFYEHGYKHAGNPSKHPDIDVPIGIPIAAEIADNKLYVWILLDKNHELAQKVYKHLQSADDRFTSKIGLSIGAIPIGKSQTKVINGMYVNVPPKMRLYEVSITGQPINIDTFVKVLKSLVYNSVEKAMEEDTMAKDLKNPEEEKQEVNLEALKEETPEVTPEEEQEMKQDEAQVLDLGDLQGEASEGVSAEAKEEGVSETPSEEAQDEVALVQEEVEEHEKEDEETFNYILDKLDFLEEKLSEVLSMLSSKAPQEENKDESVVSSSLAELKSFVEAKLASLENRVNYVVDIVEASLENFSELKSVLSKIESYNQKIESVEKSLSSFKNLYKEVNEKLESTTKSLNSVSNVPKFGVSAEVHPQTGTFESGFQEKLKSILANKTKLKSLEEKIQEYLTYKGTPIQLNEKKMELYNFAKEEFDLEPEEFELIYRQYKNNRKISQ